MKLKKLLVIVFCLYATMLFAAPVAPSTARQVAENFWSVNAGKSVTVSLVDVSQQFDFQELYIFIHPEGKGFVIVAADDCVQPVIAYSLSTAFDFPLPEHVSAYLERYNQEITWYKENNIRATSEITEMWTRMLNGTYTPRNTTSVSPLLTTTWNQSPYYNNLCPDSADIHAVTGCVATATAQVMKFWNWPVVGMGSHTYTDDNFGTLTANFGATTYNWSQMPNALNSSSTSAEVNAVATLMFHIGVAIEMDYGIESSGAYLVSYGWPASSLPCSEHALKDYFGYKNTLYSVYKNDDNVTDASWISTLTSELDAGRPVLERGEGSGGHAFVCDGYDNNGMFHINWGWGSAYDGYFAHNALNPGGGGTGSSSTHSYNDGQALIVGIEPNGVLHTSTQLLTLPQEGGNASFAVYSNNIDATSWTATSNQSWLTLSPTTGAGLGVVTTVNAIATANNTGSMRTAVITITQGNQTVTVQVQQNECATANMCQITVEMNDSYGDGWNGSYLTVSSSSGYVYGTATIASDSSGIQQFSVCPSGLQLTWTSGSQWDYECSFIVNDAAGQPLLTVLGSTTPPSGSYTIATPCVSTPPTTCTISSFPWNESFEGDINCWSLIDADGDGNNWFKGTGASYDGTYMMASYSYYAGEAMNTLNYLVTPEITLPATGTYQLGFYARSANNAYPDSLMVKLSTTGYATANNFSVTLMPKTMISDEYQLYTVNLTGYNGQTFHLAFVHDSYDGYWLVLDNVSILESSVTYTIMATSANSTMGSVTGGGTYAAGSTVTLTATPTINNHFTHWDDGNTSNPRVITVTGNASYIAYFAINQYQVTVDCNNSSMGTVTGGGTYDYGTTVSIQAIPNSGYEFQKWYDGNTDNPRSITVLGNVTYTAIFQALSGINDRDMSEVYVYSSGRQLVVCHAEGASIEIYDMLGKRIAFDANNSQSSRVFNLNTTGIYLVRVGDNYYKKVLIR